MKVPLSLFNKGKSFLISLQVFESYENTTGFLCFRFSKVEEYYELNFIFMYSFVTSCTTISILRFQQYRIVHGDRAKAEWCVKTWNSYAMSIAYEIYMLYIMLLVPVIVMTFAYVNIILELWHITSLQNRHQCGYVVFYIHVYD